ncbi:MAG: lysozyme inhibitor LprI family protein [Halobacteriota archaeon]
MKLFLVLLAFLLIIYLEASYAESTPKTGCEEWPDTSTHFEACIIGIETRQLDAKLNAEYQEVLAKYKQLGSNKERKLLIEAQRAWIGYRDKTCDFENEMGGGIDSISWIRCDKRLTHERLQYLSDL